jgi:hypothetical protein
MITLISRKSGTECEFLATRSQFGYNYKAAAGNLPNADWIIRVGDWFFEEVWTGIARMIVTFGCGGGAL